MGTIQRWPVMAGVVHSRSERVVAPSEVYVEVAVDCRYILCQYTGYFSMIAIYHIDYIMTLIITTSTIHYDGDIYIHVPPQ